jgi:hypothetical protein
MVQTIDAGNSWQCVLAAAKNALVLEWEVSGSLKDTE